MKGEIEYCKDFYCLTGSYKNGEGCILPNRVTGACTARQCIYFHHKWPTPEQYREEWGEDYPDDAAVYTLLSPNLLDIEHWNIKTFFEAIRIKEQLDAIEVKFPKKYFIVCACTPWGKPPVNWRPECR